MRALKRKVWISEGHAFKFYFRPSILVIYRLIALSFFACSSFFFFLSIYLLLVLLLLFLYNGGAHFFHQVAIAH